MAEPLHATNLQEEEGCKRVFFRDVFNEIQEAIMT